MFVLEAATELTDAEFHADAEPIDSEVEVIEDLSDILPMDEAASGDELAAEDIHEAEPAIDDEPLKPNPSVAAYEESRSNIERSISGLLIRRLHLEIEIKELKAEEKELIERLDRLISRGPQAMALPLFDQPSNEVVKEDGSPLLDEFSESPDAEEPVDDAWREVSIDELRLPSGIQSKLEDVNATTIGKLEQLRADIALGREKWPKGIGAAKITTIEDAVLAWLSGNRDRKVIEQTKAADQTPAYDGEPAGDALSPDQDLVYQRVIQLESSAPDNLLVVVGHKQHDNWLAGRAAFRDGVEVFDCSWTAGEEQDAWIMGWLFEELQDGEL